jgi:hypothetical protein
MISAAKKMNIVSIVDLFCPVKTVNVSGSSRSVNLTQLNHRAYYRVWVTSVGSAGLVSSDSNTEECLTTGSCRSRVSLVFYMHNSTTVNRVITSVLLRRWSTCCFVKVLRFQQACCQFIVKI